MLDLLIIFGAVICLLAALVPADLGVEED